MVNDVVSSLHGYAVRFNTKITPQSAHNLVGGKLIGLHGSKIVRIVGSFVVKICVSLLAKCLI